ncbi:MAG: hypothetical protein ACK57K_12015, partial [Chryseotalea sp.]
NNLYRISQNSVVHLIQFFLQNHLANFQLKKLVEQKLQEQLNQEIWKHLYYSLVVQGLLEHKVRYYSE